MGAVNMEFLFQFLSCFFDLTTTREMPYLQATMYYFVYHINTVALY